MLWVRTEWIFCKRKKTQNRFFFSYTNTYLVILCLCWSIHSIEDEKRKEISSFFFFLCCYIFPQVHPFCSFSSLYTNCVCFFFFVSFFVFFYVKLNRQRRCRKSLYNVIHVEQIHEGAELKLPFDNNYICKIVTYMHLKNVMLDAIPCSVGLTDFSYSLKHHYRILFFFLNNFQWKNRNHIA